MPGTRDAQIVMIDPLNHGLQHVIQACFVGSSVMCSYFRSTDGSEGCPESGGTRLDVVQDAGSLVIVNDLSAEKPLA